MGGVILLLIKKIAKMKSSKKFNSQVEQVGRFAYDVDDSLIKSEPMFFNCNLEFAYRKGGEITKSFISNLPIGWEDPNVVFDSRVHMLMPGWYPAIPGFHHDDVPRPEIPTGHHFITAGQPDYDNPRYKSEHIMGLVNAEVCPTEFAIGECEMPQIPDGELIYRKWHEEIKSLVINQKMGQWFAPDRTLVYFDCDTFHTGQSALSSGWRWFGRVSRNTDRVNKITNEIRSQVQVYL